MRRRGLVYPQGLGYACHMPDTIFTRILAGDIPCHRVYEDSKVLAFLDTGPLSTGHTLLIPKEPAETLDQLSDDSAAALGRVLPRLSRAVLRATGARDFNVLQNNGAAGRPEIREEKGQSMGYPDIEIKTFNKKNRNAAQRAFYLSPPPYMRIGGMVRIVRRRT